MGNEICTSFIYNNMDDTGVNREEYPNRVMEKCASEYHMRTWNNYEIPFLGIMRGQWAGRGVQLSFS